MKQATVDVTIVPLLPVPAQTLSVLLGNQQCQLRVYQRRTGLFLDVSIDNVPILRARRCVDRRSLVQPDYLGFVGDLAFKDVRGAADPEYSGLGERFVLTYSVPAQ